MDFTEIILKILIGILILMLCLGFYGIVQEIMRETEYGTKEGLVIEKEYREAYTSFIYTR